MTDALDTAGRSTPAPARARWQLRLLGDVALREAAQAPVRLPSRAAAALLARLGLAPQRAHAREELIELLWPGVALDVGRNRLRQVLSTLKSLLEHPGQAGAPVLQADRQALRLTPDALHCDVPAFEAALRQGRWAEARALYRGELMPGFFDEWIVDERTRLAALADRLDERLAAGPGLVAALPSTTPSTTPTPPLPEPLPTSPQAAAEAPGSRHLPRYLTPLHGADEVGARLRAELLQHRLVTVLGPGGHGKTRLAVEVARTLAEGGAWPAPAQAEGFDYVAFVPLVGCTSREAMLDAMLLALQQEGRSGEPLERLATLLTGRRALLLLDNAEQLADSAAPVVAALLERHAGLRLLVTSRRVLGVDGEREFVLPPLPLPGPDSSEAEAALNPAVALFVDRARAARADFHLSSRNREAVIALVRRLEGMPLAIELAASRVRSLPPAQLLAQIEAAGSGPQLDALMLLSRSGPRGGSDPRHASMLSVVQWSWQLLSPAAQALLGRLSVFAGGFTLDAAEAVCRDAGDAPVALALDELVAQSMLRSVAGPDSAQARYEPFELIRLFAAAMLPAADAAPRRARHRDWVIAWARNLALDAPLAALRDELANLGAALASARADGAADDAAALAGALTGPLVDLALPPGALRALAESAALMSQAEARAVTRAYLARALFRGGDPQRAAVQADQAWAELPPAGLPRAQVLARLAHVRWRLQRDAAADDWLVEALALAEAALAAASSPAQRAATQSLQASILATRGAIARTRDAAAAIALQRRSLALWTAAGDVHGMNTGRVNLAIALAASTVGCDEALALLDEAIASTRGHGDWQQAGQALNARGEALCRLRRWPEAAQAYRDCIRIAYALPDPLLLTYGLWNLPRALAHLRQPEAATRLMAFAETQALLYWGRLGRGDRHDLRRLQRLCQHPKDAALVAQARREGATLKLGEAVRLALDDRAG
ncbi:AfsR/SARP family transcriptional regulator [Aquabacterium sp.]|uniref:AfsR/SARP family transcriptional regulator n=1 Tax=Aquabacterium sp. TaxID=1872578 RepID=UPI00378358EB